ncbi:MFS transporter [Castellaniella sp.]|uniref:MFS transporter n=1 Tax=Castellaniella sp. TaxID=1955812 RepID=UPI002AFF9E04|nr:MFS transporter [Castellaniella sp.]
MDKAYSRRLLDRLRRRPVLEVTLACLAVLLLAQALIGALSLSALYRLNTDMTADRVEVEVRQMATGIENGLRLGKPLAQYFGLSDLLNQRLDSLPDARGAAVLLADGQVAAAQGQPLRDIQGLGRAVTHPASFLAEGLSRRANGAVVHRSSQGIAVAVPLQGAEAATVGVAVLAVVPGTSAGSAYILRNLAVLFIVTLVVGLGLAAAYKFVVRPEQLASGGWAHFFLPLVALMLAQGLYAAHTIHTFRAVSLEVTRDNARILAQGLQQDLDRVLGYGIAIDHLRNVEAPFSRLAATFPVIRSIDLLDASGKVINRAGGRGALPLDTSPPASDEMILSLPLAVGQAVQGRLVLHLDDAVIAAGVRARVIDALTVVAVALVAAIEMLLLLALMLRRSGKAVVDGGQVGRIARPVMFGFLFSWALPLGFLPLYARSLPSGGLPLSENLLMALPISVEMGCGLLTALLAGGITDRRGWQAPVLAGLGVCGLGFAACAWAPDLPWFTAARGVVGLGYGLTWMGLQGLIVTRSPANARGRNMSNVIAGLFAGHLAGAAVGAMLMEQLGFRAVFLVAVVMLLLPLSGVLILMRPYMASPRAVAAAKAVAPAVRAHRSLALAQTLRLVCTRDFGLLLLGSVIPFSVAQVGLLSYALPLYLDAQGAAASSVGRVLMIYGLCVIYLGPMMGRMADRSVIKKRWIVAGGVIGSLGLMALYLNSGLLAASLAVLLLALASCLSGAAQAPYMLALPDVQRYGAAGATSVLRAADKLGQMAGPVVVGVLFGVAGMGTGLALTGLIYLLATLLFLAFAPVSTAGQTAPEPSSQ